MGPKRASTWPQHGPKWAFQIGWGSPFFGFDVGTPRKTDLGPILGPTWGHLGAILGHLGPSWAHLGPILGHLGPILGHLGPILGLSWAFLGPFGAILWPYWVFALDLL